MCLMSISTIVIFLIILVLWYNRRYEYWKKRNIPYLEPRFPLGNLPNPFTMNEKSGSLVNRFYKEMKRRGWKHGGFYFLNIPVYVVVDLEYIKNIMVRDFEYFTDRGVFHNEKDDPLSANVMYLDGQKWKNMRNLLNPLFTSSKMKAMLPLMSKSVQILLSKLEEDTPADMYKLLSRYTANNIASCIFGLDCNMFAKENACFTFYGEKMVKQPKNRIFAWLFAAMFPRLGRALRFRIVPEDAESFFMQLTRDCVDYRKATGYRRNDVLQLLIDLKDDLTFKQLAAQCVILFLAGFETSSSTLTFALYEMATNQEIQDKAREEVMRCEELHDMKYLNQIFDETARKYAPAGLYLSRKCVKNYKIPNEDAIIEKGTMVLIPSGGIHYDEEYYPEPGKFDPERFNEANRKSRHGYTHLPFGEGPRICIGKRFALLQIKVALIALLKTYRFTVNKNTAEPLPLKVDSVTVTPANPVWLNVHKL